MFVTVSFSVCFCSVVRLAIQGGVRGAPVSLPIRGGGSRHVELFSVLEVLRADSVVELFSIVPLFEAAYVCVMIPATIAIATSASRIIPSLFLYIKSPLRFCVAPPISRRVISGFFRIELKCLPNPYMRKCREDTVRFV